MQFFIDIAEAVITALLEISAWLLTIALCIVAVITLPIWVIPYVFYTQIKKK